MKKIIMIIGALLLTAGCLTAQDSPTLDTTTRGYRSFFGSESTVWNAGLSIIDNPNLENKILYIDGDSVINGVIYKRVYMRHRWVSTDSAAVGNDFVGVCREDSLNGRFWIKTLDCLYYDLEEILIADMSLDMGDDGVDTVYYDSLGRKVIIYEYTDYPYRPLCKIVEGIGPEYVDVDHLHDIYLTCVYHNGTKESFRSSLLDGIYADEITRIDYDNCWIAPSLNIKDVTDGDYVIYPNPCTNMITVKKNDKGKVALYDIVGRKIESKFGDLVSFEMRNKDIGAYIIKITLPEKTISKVIFKN